MAQGYAAGTPTDDELARTVAVTRELISFLCHVVRPVLRVGVVSPVRYLYFTHQIDAVCCVKLEMLCGSCRVLARRRF